MIKSTGFILLVGLMILSSCEDLLNPTGGPSDKRELITDTWLCQENGTLFGQSSFEVNISKDTGDSLKIIIDNFYNLGYGKSTKATFNSPNITILQQETDDLLVSGSGEYNKSTDRITLNYTVEYSNGDIDEVSSTLER